VEEEEAGEEVKKTEVNNPKHRLKTGKRAKPGRPKGKHNARCCDCSKSFHNAPAHLGKIRRCHRCRKNMQGKPRDYRSRHTCPLCNGYKHQKSNICVNCWNDGRRWDAIIGQEK